MAQRRINAGFRVIKGEGAHPGGAVAHPRAHARRAGGRVQARGHGGGHGHAVPGILDIQRLPVRSRHQLRQLVGAGDAHPVHLSQHVPRAKAAQRGGAGRVAQVAHAHHHHALGAHGYANGAAAGNQSLFGLNVHLHPLDGKKPHQAQKQLPRAGGFAGDFHLAPGGQGFILRGGHRQVAAPGRQGQPAAQGQGARLPLREADALRQGAEGFLHGGKIAEADKHGQHKACGPPDVGRSFHGQPSLSPWQCGGKARAAYWKNPPPREVFPAPAVSFPEKVWYNGRDDMIRRKSHENLNPAQAVSAVLFQVQKNRGLRPVLRGADHRVRAGAAADCILHHRQGHGGSRVADRLLRADHGRRVSAHAGGGRGGQLLYAVGGPHHGLPHGNRHAPRPVPSPAAAVLQLLFRNQGGADYGPHHIRPV